MDDLCMAGLTVASEAEYIDPHPATMNKVLARALDFLEAVKAFEDGCDSGIHDTARQRDAAAIFDAATEDERRVALSIWVRESYLTDDKIKLQYGWEDARNFLNWIDSGEYRR